MNIQRLLKDIENKEFTSVKTKRRIISETENALGRYLNKLHDEINPVRLKSNRSFRFVSEIFVETRLLYNFRTQKILPERAKKQQLGSEYGENADTFQYIDESEYITKEEVLEKFKKVIFLGQPGIGKTTLVTKIILDLINTDQSALVPAYLPLRNTLLQQIGIERYLFLQFSDSGIANPDDLVRLLLKKGKMLLVLDGIDEIARDIKPAIIDQILSFSNIHSSNIFIATCRQFTYNSELRSFKDVFVVDFSPEGVREFTQKWFDQSGEEDKAATLLKKIQAYPQIEAIAANPLFLTMICYVFSTDLDFSARRTTLYSRCIELLLREWDAERNFRRMSGYSRLDEQKKIALLSELAYRLHSNSQIYFERIDLVNYLEESIEKYGIERTQLIEVIEEIMSHHGFLIEVSEGMYSFSHLTFQEYFTANYIATTGTGELEIDKHLGDPFWEEVFVLAASLMQDATKYATYILNKECDSKQNILLAALLLSSDPIVERSVKEKIVQEIVDLFHNGSWHYHSHCLMAIAKIDDTFVGKKLLDSLNVDRSYLEDIARKNKRFLG